MAPCANCRPTITTSRARVNAFGIEFERYSKLKYSDAHVLLPAVKLLLGKKPRGAHAAKTRADVTIMADMYVAGVESRWGANLSDAMRKEFIQAWLAGYQADGGSDHG